MLSQTLRCLYLYNLVYLFHSDIYSGVGLIDHMVIIFLIFLETSILFSIADAPIPPTAYRSSMFSRSTEPTRVGCFDNSHADRCELIDHCGFHLHSSDDEWCWESFHLPVDHLHSSLEKDLFSSSAHFKINCEFLFLYWVVWAIYICCIIIPNISHIYK